MYGGDDPGMSENKEPLRVLMVMTSMDRGGMETFTMNIYRAIDRGRVQFDFLVHRDKVGAYEDEIKALGGHIFRICRQNPLDVRYWRSLNSFFSAHPYRAVHAQLDCLSAIPLMVAKNHGAAVRVAHSHSSRQDRNLKYPVKMVCKPLIKHVATHLFSCGVEAGRWMFGTDDFIVIKNAIDINMYEFDKSRRARMRSELGISHNSLVVGHVGRFVPAKNHSMILNVFAKLLELRPDAVLLLVGGGDLRIATEEKAAALGVLSSVRFLGVRNDIPDLLQAMDCFLMPSIYEGLPMVLVEAQASGLPCLISDSIPTDCDFDGGSIERLSLSRLADEWAARIYALSKTPKDRSDGTAVVRAAGFDAHSVASELEGFYLSAHQEKGLR